MADTYQPEKKGGVVGYGWLLTLTQSELRGGVFGWLTPSLSSEVELSGG